MTPDGGAIDLIIHPGSKPNRLMVTPIRGIAGLTARGEHLYHSSLTVFVKSSNSTCAHVRVPGFSLPGAKPVRDQEATA